MSGKRKNTRLRNRMSNITINSNTIIIGISVFIICILIIVLIIKSTKTQNIETNIDEKLYVLFEEMDLASKNLGEIVAESEKDKVINIVTVGDILCEEPIYKSAYDDNTGEYDFAKIFSNISKYTSEADITIGLLETNFVEGEELSGSIKYNAPKEFGSALKDIGIDVLNTANNHSLDYGYEGIKSTIDYLEELKIDTTGTYRTEQEAGEILIKNVNGIKLAFLSYTEDYKNYKSQIEGNEYIINLVDEEKMKNDIEKAKREGADFVFVHMHWGELTENVQNKEQEKFADFLYECGADFVIRSHPASLQPMETRKNNSGKNMFISYSTGNFISASKYEYSEIEMILNIQIVKSGKTGETQLAKVSYIPVYLLDTGEETENRYILLDIPEEISKYENNDNRSVSKQIYDKLKKAIQDIEVLVRKEYT